MARLENQLESKLADDYAEMVDDEAKAIKAIEDIDSEDSGLRWLHGDLQNRKRAEIAALAERASSLSSVHVFVSSYASECASCVQSASESHEVRAKATADESAVSTRVAAELNEAEARLSKQTATYTSIAKELDRINMDCTMAKDKLETSLRDKSSEVCLHMAPGAHCTRNDRS